MDVLRHYRIDNGRIDFAHSLTKEKALAMDINAILQSLGDTPTERMCNMMARLRDPDIGCPWDIKQDFKTIAPYTIEEAYEVADAIEREDMADLKEELGDLLLQVVFHSQMANELAPDPLSFDFNAVADGLTEKMVRRHPHVFTDGIERDAESQAIAWEAQKAAERKEKARKEIGTTASILEGIALNLPALTRAEKLQKRAARVGFDWPDIEPVLGKVREEFDEVIEAKNSDAPHNKIEEEVGDLFFALVNVARHLKVDPELALRRANMKFTHRFNDIEKALNDEGVSFSDENLEQLDARWNTAKAKGL